jgi:endonuclease/exonuclease/phosphatase family metal-dependent hydrolase
MGFPVTMGRIALSTLALMLVAFGAHVRADGTIERSHYVSNSFNVLAYNVFMRPEYAFSNDQAERAALLPGKLRGFDVLVFSEAFDNSIRNALLTGLAAEYPYRTRVLGSDGGIEQDGGVILVSRWPIAAEAQRAYAGVCIGDVSDCLADKGVLYARVVKHGQSYHVFASHTQAGDSPERRAVRLRQLGIVKAFIDSRAIPDSEPVFIAGDLNVDKYDAGEYAAMLRILDAWHPVPFGYRYTVDPTLNRLNPHADRRLYLDYVLVSNRHLQPIEAIIETLMPRSTTPFKSCLDPLKGGCTRSEHSYDLSDHFAVFGHFMFPSPAATLAATGN